MTDERIRALVRGFTAVQSETIKLLAENPAAFNVADVKAVGVLRHRLRLLMRPLSELEALVSEWLHDVTVIHVDLSMEKTSEPKKP